MGQRKQNNKNNLKIQFGKRMRNIRYKNWLIYIIYSMAEIVQVRFEQVHRLQIGFCPTLTVQITSEESRCAPRSPHLCRVYVTNQFV